MYETARLAAGLSREAAAEGLHIGNRTLYDYEKHITPVPPEVVLEMARLYKTHALPGNHCASECPIGRIIAYKIQTVPIPVAVLTFLKEFEDVRHRRDRLIDITCDGQVSPEEEAEFGEILREILELERSITTLKYQVAGMFLIQKQAPEKKMAAVYAAAG